MVTPVQRPDPASKRSPTTAPATVPVRRVRRRAVLQWAGIGAGATLVTGGAGVLWRAEEQGVFDTGQGPAYRAWQEWRVTPGDPPVALVRPALLAANAHNTRPWRFLATADRLDLFADTARTMGTLDPLRRELELSLGCAPENLLLAARTAGFIPTLTLLPTLDDPTHMARVDLALSPAHQPRSLLCKDQQRQIRPAYRAMAQDSLLTRCASPAVHGVQPGAARSGRSSTDNPDSLSSVTPGNLARCLP